MTRLPVALAAALLVAVQAVATPAVAAPTYRIKLLPLPAGATSGQAVAVNDAGDAVGWYQVERGVDHHAALWRAGAVVTLGALPGDVTSYATGVNDRGQVIGYSGEWQDPGAFVWDAVGGMQALGAFDPAHRYSIPDAIDAAGTVVGLSVDAAGVQRPFTWTPALGMVDPLGGAGAGEAAGINANGAWTGHVDGANRTSAVRVDARGHATALGYLSNTAGQRYAYGRALNKAGTVVGYAAAGDYNHAFVWDKANGMRDLGVLPGGNFSNATGINTAGVVVGIADIPSGGRGQPSSRPFYWTAEGGMVDLTTLIDPADPLKASTQLDDAFMINDHGVVAVDGLVNGKLRALLLVPQD